MKQRTLGKTEINVSEVAFGGVEIGIPYGIGIKNKSDMLSEEEAINLLHASLDSGINFFDTARIYGNSEKIIGKTFKDKRDKVVICTKCRHLRDEHNKIPESSKLKQIIETSLNESIEALQTNYVDIFMLHQSDLEILGNDEISTLFLNLKREGRFRATGVSTYSPEETQKAIDAGIWDVIQLPFNLMDQRQEKFFSLASQKGIGLVVRSVLLKGLLSDKGKGLHPALKEVESHIKRFGKLIEGTTFNLSTFATKFALSFEEVSSVLIGIDRQEYLQKSLDAADGIYLDDSKLAMAKELSYPDPEFLNLQYWDKMNWLR